MIIEVRQACFDPTLNSTERSQMMYGVISAALYERAQEIRSMADESETEEQAVWIKAIQK